MKGFSPGATAAPPTHTDQGGQLSPRNSQELTRAKEDALRSSDASVVVVDSRSLIRDCLVRNLQSAVNLNILGVASLDECLWLASANNIGLVLLSCPGALDSKANQDLLEKAFDALPDIPILILSDSLSTSAPGHCSEAHPSGYISTSMPLDVAIAAIRVVQSGRPPPKPTAPPPEIVTPPPATEPPAKHEWLREYFTTRQIAVIDALRKGKANKIIAYELNMKESTVKVHVRNIMKRLKAHNRTEVSYIANQLAAGRVPEGLKCSRTLCQDSDINLEGGLQ